MVINWYKQETYSLKHTGDFTKYSYKKVLLFYRQCPPLSGPMLNLPFSDSRVIIFSLLFVGCNYLFYTICGTCLTYCVFGKV